MCDYICHTVLPCCYALLAVTPPPHFGRNYCIGLFYLHYPAGRLSQFAVLQFLHVCTCCKCRRSCIKRVENSSRTGLGLFTALRWFPDAVILPYSLAASGRSLAARLYLLCFAKKWERHVDRRSSRLLSYNRALLISVRKFVGGGA